MTPTPTPDWIAALVPELTDEELVQCKEAIEQEMSLRAEGKGR